ncbi:type I-F CRISPR-associated endoribonuclease Cas6/Csy4, partial [Acinetobacter baumannii]
MKWYHEITLIDQDESSLSFICSKVYTKLHIAF